MADKDYMSDPKSKSLNSIIEAFHIFAKHLKEGMDTKYTLQSEHDVIYMNLDGDDIAEDSVDGLRLQAIGWHLDSDGSCWAMFT